MADSTEELRAEYRALAERNWNAIQSIHRGYDRFNRRAKRLLALLFVLQLATGAGLAISLSSTSAETHARISAIQAQRRDSILGNCAAQNDRHDATILELDRGLVHAAGGRPDPHATDAQLVAQLARLVRQHPSPRTTQLTQSRAFTVLLIDALAPKHDCNAVANAAVTTDPRAARGSKP